MGDVMDTSTIPTADELIDLRQVVQLKIFGSSRLAEVRRWCRQGKRQVRLDEPVILKSIKDGRNRIMTTRAWCEEFKRICDAELKKAFVTVKRTPSKVKRRLDTILG